MMDFKRIVIAAVLSFLMFPASSGASELIDSYVHALEENDMIKQSSIIEANKDKLPAEIKALLNEAASMPTKEEKEGKFFLAELVARAYKDATGDFGPLKEVKKTAFDAKLSAPLRSTAANGVHVIDMPRASDNEKNVFRPDNILIKKGETVRWVNNDSIAHIFSAMTAISAGGFSSKSVEPGGSFEFKFEKPGEYFYLCFIHQAMVGKVTVEE